MDESAVRPVWCLMDVLMSGAEGGDPSAFGASVSTMTPKVDPLFEGDSAMVSVGKTRPLQCGNTEPRLFALALNREVNKVCATCLSPEQRGFIIGRSMADSVVLCEASMGAAV